MSQLPIDGSLSTQWALANVQTKGAAGGSEVIFDLFNRNTQRAHRLKLIAGGVDVGPLPVSFSPSSSMSEYTYFSTSRPVSFDDFDGVGARLISGSALLWSWSSLFLWGKAAYVGTVLAANVRMSGWGVGLPGAGLDHGVAAVVYGDGKPLGDVEATIQFSPPPEPEAVDANVQLQARDDSFVIIVQGDILFAIDKAEVRPEAETPLKQAAAIARSARRTGGAILINGHADDTGAEPHNIDLSRRRASAVYQFFSANKLLPAEVISTHGYGSARPLMPGKDSASRAKNRRVEIYVRNP